MISEPNKAESPLVTKVLVRAGTTCNTHMEQPTHSVPTGTMESGTRQLQQVRQSEPEPAGTSWYRQGPVHAMAWIIPYRVRTGGT